jgi:hypothetical protein
VRMDREIRYLKSFLFNEMYTLLQLIEIKGVRGALLSRNVRNGEIVSMIFGRAGRVGGLCVCIREACAVRSIGANS